MKHFVRLALVVGVLASAVTAGAVRQPFHQAEHACVKLGGSFGVFEDGNGYFCNFGGSPPPRADKHWYGPTYEKICARYGGTIFEEFPPPYSYTCTLTAP
jgi:hypothetical protein